MSDEGRKIIELGSRQEMDKAMIASHADDRNIAQWLREEADKIEAADPNWNQALLIVGEKHGKTGDFFLSWGGIGTTAMEVYVYSQWLKDTAWETIFGPAE